MYSFFKLIPRLHYQHYLVIAFLFMLPSLMFAQGNRAVPVVDSVKLAQQDSLLQVKHIQDSLATAFIVVNPNRGNPMLDSLRAKVVVADNDFISWMAFTNSLLKKDAFQKMTATDRFDRPLWVLFVVLFLFFCIGLVRLFFVHVFQNIVLGFFNERILTQISKEDNVVTSWPYIFLYIIFSFSLAMFILIYQSSFVDNSVITVINFFRIAGIVGAMFLLKILLVRFVASIFQIERLAREYVTVLYLVYFNSMLILMPLLLFVTFSTSQYFKFILILFSVVVSILFLYRVLRTAYNLLGNLRFSLFYLILYLCTLEIAPILILVKTLNN
ncbi:DUF4271 domain-containing protein [Sphingobacterium sp. Mn56C]|uniref:DUF4271 domain-containing protein n=1 Tax=Sphingobacterium sp. Mn56C TaxID=3395261 RepID=UPI003BD75A20